MKRTITLIALVAALLIPSIATAQRMPVKSGMRLSQFKTPAAAPARVEEEPIMDAPEGILYDSMYATSFAYGLGLGDIYTQNVDGGIGKVVEGTDGNLYIYNPISQGFIWFSILPWIKAEPTDDGKYVVSLPQLYIIDVGDPYYAYCMHYDEDEGMPVVEEEGEIEFTWENGVLTQLGDKFIGLCDATADWFYMADQHIVYTPQTDEVTTLPDGMLIHNYTLTYLSDPTDLTQTKETLVSVAIDGQDIYMGNLNNNPDTFIKGTLADGKATFPTRQYLGVDAYYNGHIYVLTGEAYVDTETYGSPVFNYNLNDEIVFNVDEDAHNIVAEWPAAMVTNVGPNTLSIISDYVAPVLAAIDWVPDDPHMQGFWLILINKDGEPVWVPLNKNSSGNYINYIQLNFEEYGTYDPIIEDRPNVPFYYMIDGTPYGAEENNTTIAIGDAWQNPLFEGTTNYYEIPVGFNYTLGVAIDEGQYYAFSAMPFEGVEELFNNKQVAGVRYFNMAGQEMQQADGICIVVTTYSDGTTTTTKVMK